MASPFIQFTDSRCDRPLACIESALITSPLNSDAISIASLDFPVAVAPKITIIGFNLFAMTDYRKTNMTCRLYLLFTFTPKNIEIPCSSV